MMPRLSLLDRYELFDELAIILTHVPQDVPQHLRTKLGLKLKPFLLRGLSLGQSFSQLGGERVVVGLLDASQGQLKSVVVDIVRYYRLLLDIRASVQRQLLCPVVTLITAIFVLIGFFVFIYPVLASIGETRISISPLFLGGLGVLTGYSILYYRQLRERLINSTGLPQLFERLHVVLLIQLAPDTLSLVRILRQYDPGRLAGLCFQLERAVPLSTALHCLCFSERELLLIEQACAYGDRQIYDSLIESLRLAIETKAQALMQMIEPAITVITGSLVALCVYVMLMPVIQLQAGLTF